jgi:hypothetical protein
MVRRNNYHRTRWNTTILYIHETNNTGIFTHEAGTDFKYSVTDANNCNAANGTFTVVEPEAIIQLQLLLITQIVQYVLMVQ